MGNAGRAAFTAEDLVATALAETPAAKLTGFALTGYVAIPREREFDFLVLRHHHRAQFVCKTARLVKAKTSGFEAAV